ncbi:retrovirus-related Pol polyprotein from transposon 17.6 [Elysia marginata]|uniref:Retrovirus-related Pol polyprotein from transposon 17.6 n=1 Tax=Elysia marginata TaxID=1093978 RepID=A0AAV4GIF8_9GAST|nr:retrovirus-related Pol polyprotein from transposon 17.6 [Elysia marginata]
MCCVAFTSVDRHCGPIRKQVEKIVELTRPTTKKQVRSLMGLFSYYRSFVPDFAALSCPLTDLLRKGSPDRIVWSDECERSFSRIKTLLASDPILIIPDLHAEFILRTDASDYGLGAVLLQERHGTLMPCRYASRKLSPREVRYSAIERECLAIVFAVTNFYKFLAFKPFHLETDHKPLLFLKSGKAKNSRLMCWALALQEFAFSISALPGEQNVHADALSRLC